MSKPIFHVSLDQALRLLIENGTKIIGVTFTKKDGSVRDMNAHPKPAPKPNGQGLRYNPADHNLKLMIDLPKRQSHLAAVRRGDESVKAFKDEGYRMVSYERISEIRMGGAVFVINRW